MIFVGSFPVIFVFVAARLSRLVGRRLNWMLFGAGSCWVTMPLLFTFRPRPIICNGEWGGHASEPKKKKMEPIQHGLGRKFGMHRMALTAQDLYAQGWSIAELDAENAFNRASRQKMLDVLRASCPHLLQLFWMGYCSHSPAVLL